MTGPDLRAAPYEVDPETLATAASALPGVAALSGGVLDEIVSYLPGRKVAGIRVRPDGVAVGIVGKYGSDLQAVSAEVRHLVNRLYPTLPCTVLVQDVTDPPGSSDVTATMQHQASRSDLQE